MKTAELVGTQLDYWVAKAKGYVLTRSDYGDKPLLWDTGGGLYRVDGPPGQPGDERWAPSTNWWHGGPIIERERISLLQPGYGGSSAWEAGVNAYNSYDGWEAKVSMEGPTALVAAMRAYVASKFGDEVAAVPPS